MSCNGQRVARHPWIGVVLSARGPSTSAARLVSCGLFNHMEREGTGATAAERTLAIETGMSRSTVQLALRTLQEEGWLLRREKGRGQYGRTIYVYEATIPLGSVDMDDPPMDRPPGQLPNLAMDRPSVANGPITGSQWTDSQNSLDRPSGLNHSETVLEPVMAASRPDPGLKKATQKTVLTPEERIAKAVEAWKKGLRDDAFFRRQYGVTANEVRREIKFDRKSEMFPADSQSPDE